LEIGADIDSRMVVWNITSMQSTSLSQLRNTRQLIAWLKARETTELRERKRVIGHIIPVGPWPRLDDDGPQEAEASE
jgi:hypothetical protein